MRLALSYKRNVSSLAASDKVRFVEGIGDGALPVAARSISTLQYHTGGCHFHTFSERCLVSVQLHSGPDRSQP